MYSVTYYIRYGSSKVLTNSQYQEESTQSTGRMSFSCLSVDDISAPTDLAGFVNKSPDRFLCVRCCHLITRTA